MRVVDAWLSMPGILLYLIAAAIIQAYKLSLFWNTVGLIIALGVAQTPSMARLVRGSVLAEREREYVEASHVIGEGHLYIAFCQILPNCLSPVIIQGTISLGIEMLVLAALSFLGLGAPPPTPDWGADLNLAREHMETLPYLAIFPRTAYLTDVLVLRTALAPPVWRGCCARHLPRQCGGGAAHGIYPASVAGYYGPVFTPRRISPRMATA